MQQQPALTAAFGGSVCNEDLNSEVKLISTMVWFLIIHLEYCCFVFF